MDSSATLSRDVRQHNNFGFLRLLFAALVVISHSPELIDGNRSREILTGIFGTLSFGELAVDGFFLISGYLITKSFQNSVSTSDYLLKRVLRIYPGFIVAFLFSILVIGPLAGGDLIRVPLLENIVKLGTLGPPSMPGAFEGLPYPDINGPLWTIRYEFRCYLSVIFVSYLARRATRTGYAVILLVLLILLSAIYMMRHNSNALLYIDIFVGNPISSARLASVFFTGGAFYIWRHRVNYTHRGAALAAISLVGLMFVPRLAEPALAIFGGYLIFWYAFACPNNRISRGMDHVDPSYGLYLYAWPVQNLLIFNMSGISPWTVTAITLPVAIALGLLSWHLIEKPAMRYKHLFARPRKGPVDRVIVEREQAP